MKMKDFSIVALTLVGAIITSCSKDNKIIDIQQPQQDNVVTLTSNININSGTRALNDDGTNCTKTFAAGDQVAVVYKNTSNETVKALSNALTAGDISNAGKTATITVTLTNPADNGNLQLIYPAAMAKATIATDATVDDAGTVNFDALASQNGTLASLASNLDLCTFTGALNGTDLPNTASLTNKLAICKFTINDNASNDITSSVTKFVITDGTGIYTVTPSSLSSIYVAIPPVASEKTITLTATKGSEYFTKSVTGKALAASNLYPITVGMNKAYAFSVGVSKKVLIAPGNLQATTTDNGTTWTWAFAANQWDFIGNAAANTSINGDGTVSANGTVDLFGWVGATGGDAYGISNRQGNVDYYGKETGESLKSDWGNTIGSGWRTPTIDEWYCLIETRESGATVNGTSNARRVYATINTDATEVNGMILFPDGVTISTSEATSWGSINGAGLFTEATKCTSAQWNALAAKGCVFLPAAGLREGITVGDYRLNKEAYYWSATPSASYSYRAQNLKFASGSLASSNWLDRYYGASVRLVRDL